MNPASPMPPVPAWATESRPEIDGIHHKFTAPTVAFLAEEYIGEPRTEVRVFVVQIDSLEIEDGHLAVVRGDMDLFIDGLRTTVAEAANIAQAIGEAIEMVQRA